MLELRSPLTAADGPRDWSIVRAESDGSAVAALAVDPIARRIRLGLPFLDGARVIDVSIQPGVWVEKVGAAAEALGAAPNTWKDRIRADLVAAGITAEWWTAAEMARLDAVTVAIRAAWPLLRSTPSVEREIPRWAAPLLERPTVAEGARELLGDRVTRPVVRSLASRLESEIDWWPFAIATAATSVRGDHLARLIDTASSAPDGRRAGAVRPTVDDVELLRTVLADADPLRIIRLLTPPEGTTADDHARDVLAVADGWRRAMPRAGALPPSVELMRQRITTLQGSGPAPGPSRRRGGAARRWWPSENPHPAEVRLSDDRAVPPPSQPADEPPLPPTRNEVPPATPMPASPDWQVPRAAPDVVTTTTGDRFDHPPAARRLDRRRHGEVALALPDGPAQLEAWGDELHNCLGDFAEPIAVGRSVVFGVFVDDELIGALELDGSLRITQLLGPRNAPLERWVEAAVVELLP